MSKLKARSKLIADATVSGQLRRIIAARRISPYAVAQAAGIDPSILSRFVGGGRSLSGDSMDRVCEALGVELRETRKGQAAARKAATGDDRHAATAGPPPSRDAPAPDLTPAAGTPPATGRSGAPG